MKKFLCVLGLGLGLTVAMAAGPTAAQAHDAYDDSQANPFRLLAYAVSPIGFGLEWLVTRPIHFLVSEPQLEKVFGHGPHEDPFTSDPYRAESDDY
jgi:hypothetical protein